MNTRKAYDKWSEQYDTNINKTRDLEAIALRNTLAAITFDCCLEIGCGAGKNTEWLRGKAATVTAVDLSDEMLAKAKEKIKLGKVNFIQADITGEWSFAKPGYDLVSFSLVLEHIEDLENIFKEISKVIVKGGYVYIGELHPFKQYAGTKARFETDEGVQVLTCFDHQLSDFTGAAKMNGFEIVELSEYFDDDDRTTIPRIITFLFRKK